MTVRLKCRTFRFFLRTDPPSSRKTDDSFHPVPAHDDHDGLQQNEEVEEQTLVFEVVQIVLDPLGQGRIAPAHYLLISCDAGLGFEASSL